MQCKYFDFILSFKYFILLIKAPKLAPVREFMTALINIGKKLPHVPTKEKKSK